MTKPIAILYIPDSDSGLGLSSQRQAMDFMESLNDGYGDPNPSGRLRTNGFWKDYYWFVFVDCDIRTPKLKVFYEKDFTKIQFNELKDLVLNHIKTINHENNIH